MKEKFNEKVIPVILKFINTKAIQSIKNGMVTSKMCIRDSVAMYRSDFKHTLSYCVDSFGMYMYTGYLELWKYYTYLLNYKKCFS